MSVLILVVITMLQTSPEAGVPAEEEKSLEELCAEYRQLSEQLTQDYLAVQEATIQARKDNDLLPEIKANSNYAKTRVAFKEVVRKLGTRSCPVDLEDDFPPLVTE